MRRLRRATEDPALRPPAGSFLRSFVHAAAGVVRVWRSERNFRVQLACGWAVLSLAWLQGLPAARVAVLAAAAAAVLAAETMNAALEVAVDLAHPDRHPLAGAAKDLAAGAVLLAAAGAALASAAVFWPLWREPALLMAAARARPVAGWLILAGLAASAGQILLPLGGRRPC